MARSPTNGESQISRRRKAASREPSGSHLARREAVLAAAAGVFQTRGLAATRMEHIAAHLDIDRATLYYYFDNKQQIFRALVIDAVEENLATAQGILAGEGSGADKLRAMIVALFESFERHYPLLYVYVQEDLRRLGDDESPQAAQLAGLSAEYERVLKRAVEQGVAAGEFGPGTRPTLTAYAIIGAANWSHRWFDPGGDLTGAEVGEYFADLLLRGLV